MNILYLGDIMGSLGIRTVENLLPSIRTEYQVDVVIAQAENTTAGKGISLEDFAHLRKIGIDFCTGGNWSLNQPDIIQAMNDPVQPIIRPANYPVDTPGLGYKYIKTNAGSILVISLLGQIVGRDSAKPINNPLKVVDAILESQKNILKIATVVNFHGDYSSEKFVVGRYLDGRASLVVGDHWHVPTADAMVLPGGTAHISDVGMCGSLDSCLGVKTSIIMDRWQSGRASRNELESAGRLQFNAVLADIDINTGLANGVQHIRQIIDK